MKAKAGEKIRVVLSEVTAMGNGHVCIAGWCEEKGRMVRPLRNNGHRHWPEEMAAENVLAVGSVLELQTSHSSVQRGAPHQREDLTVEPLPGIVDRLGPSELQERFRGSLAPSVTALFVNRLEDKKYVEAGAQCPSLGAIEINARSLGFELRYDKLRCWFYSDDVSYNFPVTSLELRQLFDQAGLRALEARKKAARVAQVRIGLANPWPGKEGEYDPRRCYAQVNGIIFGS